MVKRDAKTVIKEAIAYRERWGEHGFGNVVNPDELLAASKELLEYSEQVTVDPVALAEVKASQEDLTLVKRQLTAAKAREGKQKKQIENLQRELKEAQSVIRDMQLSSEG